MAAGSVSFAAYVVYLRFSNVKRSAVRAFTKAEAAYIASRRTSAWHISIVVFWNLLLAATFWRLAASSAAILSWCCLSCSHWSSYINVLVITQMTKDISLSSRPSPGSFSSIFGMERSFPSWHLDKFVWATFSRPQQTGVPSDGTRRNVQLEKKLSRKTAVRIIWNQRCYPWYLFLIQHQEYYVTMKNGSCETTHKKVCVDWDVPCCCCHTFQSRYTEKRFIVFSRAIGFWHVFVVFLFLHRKSKLVDAPATWKRNQPKIIRKQPIASNFANTLMVKICCDRLVRGFL